MRLYYDLHIHSCFSPCAEDDMTPANICAMAKLKGLDVIAITDHQSAGNLRAAAASAAREGIMLLPGIELCSREEVHLLAYFPGLEQAEEMGAWCRARLPHIANRPDFFGRQLYVDEEDQVLGEEERLLVSALDVGLSELANKVRALGGVPVPAHINRGDNGLLARLGLVPEGDGYSALEVCAGLPLPPGLEGYRHLHSSDAHRLGDIAERGASVDDVESIAGLLGWMAGGATKKKL